MDELEAPGWPGIEPKWTSSAKSAVGTAASGASRVWFTVSHGIINEVYYPGVDTANTRDCGFLIAGPDSYFSEEKRDCASTVETVAAGVPAVRLNNASHDGRYSISKTIIAHPYVSALVQRVRFAPGREDQRLFALMAPHIGNRGSENNGWLGDYKGVPMLFAQRGATVLALACSSGFAERSVGFVGTSDGWTQISSSGELAPPYTSARNGNIALSAEIDLTNGHEFTLAIGFGKTPAEAGQAARLSFEQPFQELLSCYVEDWTTPRNDHWHVAETAEPRPGIPDAPLAAMSVAVLRTHESKDVPGGFVASLSIPWGNSQGDDDLGGYHLVWPRDLVEIAGGLLAAGESAAARRILQYLIVTQNSDGSWPQNMWLDGTPFWSGLQMDEVGLPILLAGQLEQADVLGEIDPWPTIRKAAAFLVHNGPATPEDRWEENPGYSPFTLAVEIAALLVAAVFADGAGEHEEARYLRETADAWNANVERWTYVSGSALAKSLDIDGYYVRIAPDCEDGGTPMARRTLRLKNREGVSADELAASIVSPDALALVRFGLRRADDPRILSTVAAIDAVLKSETTTGPVWHRYVGDGYGEHEDGSAFDGTGIGRGWPLFAGERGHYELAAGNRRAAKLMLETMGRQTSEGGLLPEQIWDADDIPEKELFNGKPSGSAMPLAWAHAEYLKLARSLADGAVFDAPPQVVQRYAVDQTPSNLASWRFDRKCRSIPAGSRLRIEILAPADVVWTADKWSTTNKLESAGPWLGMHVADLATEQLAPGATVDFTFFWREPGTWEGENFQVIIEARTQPEFDDPFVAAPMQAGTV